MDDQLRSLRSLIGIEHVALTFSDDASPDDTFKLLVQWAEYFVAVGVSARALRTPSNLGYVRHFSAVLRSARGEVLFLCDQDDIWHAEKIAAISERFERDSELLMVHSDARLIDAAGVFSGHTLFGALDLCCSEIAAIHSGRAFSVLVRRSCVTGATMAVRRSVVELALPVGDGWIHDEWLAVVAAAIGKVDVIEKCLIDYRQHGGNAVGMRVRNWRDKWEDLRKARTAQFQQEVHRLNVLQERLLALGDCVSSWKLALLAERLTHLQWRLQVGAEPHVLRVLPVLCEWWSGRYARFGTGWRSALRDLLRRD